MTCDHYAAGECAALCQPYCARFEDSVAAAEGGSWEGLAAAIERQRAQAAWLRRARADAADGAQALRARLNGYLADPDNRALLADGEIGKLGEAAVLLRNIESRMRDKP